MCIGDSFLKETLNYDWYEDFRWFSCHLMDINPLKLFGNESVIKPLQTVGGHIQPPAKDRINYQLICHPFQARNLLLCAKSWLRISNNPTKGYSAALQKMLSIGILHLS